MVSLGGILMRLVLAGPARSGKDTAGLFYKNLYSGEILRLADGLYSLMDAVQVEAGIDRVKNRKLLTDIDDLVKSHSHELVWVNALRSKITPHGNSYVVDGRYEYEFNALRSDGFHIIRIYSRDEDRQSRCEPGDTISGAHKSEQCPSSYLYDAIVYNTGTVGEFHTNLWRLACDITNRKLQQYSRTEYGSL